MKIEQGVKRFDLGELREATRTPQGFLMVPGFATRTGVFPYIDGTGRTRYELRHPDDVLDPVSLNTLKYAPVTIEHPPVMVDPGNVGEYGVGHTTERVEVNRDLVDTDLIVERQDGIDAIEKDGIRELSSGYFADIVEEEGVYNGTPYNYRQKNIRYNHLAMVRRGRAGPEVRIRLDHADAVGEGLEAKRSEYGNEGGVADSDPVATVKPMKKVVIQGTEVDLPSDIADTVQDMMDRYDEMRAKLYQLEDSMSTKARKDQTDVDVSQKGVSPQVKVEQMGPDGRASAGKAGAGDKSGVAKAKGLDAEEEEKDDEEEEGKKDEDGEKKDAEKSSLEALKKDYDAMKDKMDAMQAKIDEAAAASMSKGEKSPEGKGKMDSADFQTKVRARAKLERTAALHVSSKVAEKFDGMSDDEIRIAVIKAHRPKADLSDVSTGYIRARFDAVIETLEDEGDDQGAEVRRDAGRAMLGGARNDSGDEVEPDPSGARLKMIQGGREEWKAPLSKVKQ